VRQAVVGHVRVRPHQLYQLLLVHDLIAVTKEDHEGVERLRCQRDRLTIASERARCDIKAKRTECVDVVRRRHGRPLTEENW